MELLKESPTNVEQKSHKKKRVLSIKEFSLLNSSQEDKTNSLNSIKIDNCNHLGKIMEKSNRNQVL